jgi:hypothetical protein
VLYSFGVILFRGGQSRVSTSFWFGVKIIFFSCQGRGVGKLFDWLMVGEGRGRKMQLCRHLYIYCCKMMNNFIGLSFGWMWKCLEERCLNNEIMPGGRRFGFIRLAKFV